jgi:hypothetical protein
VFVSEAIRLIVHWLRHVRDMGLWHEVKSYDPVALSIVVVVLLLVFLTCYTVWLMVELLKLRRSLRDTSRG